MLRMLFILSIFIPGFVLSLQDRFMALLMYLWFAFFRPQDWIWFDITSLRLSLVLGFLLLVPAVFSGIWPNLTHLLSIGTVLFFLSALVAQANAVNQQMGWVWIDFFGRLALICLLMVSLTTSAQKMVRVLAVIGGSLGFHAAKAGVASIVGGGVRFADGLTGAFVDNNGYALGTVMIMPLLLAVGLNAHWLFDGAPPWVTRWARLGFLAALPLCAFTVISTFSRGGFLALCAAGLAYVALHQKRVRLSMSGAAIVVLGLTFAPIPEGYFDRLETISTYEEIGEESAISRTHFWRVAVKMVEDKPLGVGLRNYEATYDKYDFSYGKYGVRRAVHSSHFQVLSELGLLGTGVWIALFAIAFVVATRVRLRARHPALAPAQAAFLISVSNCLVASMVGFLVGGSFIALALNDVTWLTFGLLAALDRLAGQMVRDAVAPPVAAAPAEVMPPTVPRPRVRRPVPAAMARMRQEPA